MAKEELLEFEGKVLENLSNGMFKILLDGIDAEIIGHLSGRLRKNNIKIVQGDRVRIEMSKYDNTKGRINWRF